MDSIWIFHGAGSQFASGVFSTKELAIAWIEDNDLQGILTKYPVDISVYDWAIEKGFFTPKNEAHRKPLFIQRFSSGSQEHYHFEKE